MGENLSLAFQSVWNHKLRSFLTMLGIIIGIAAIITIVSTIKGTNEQIKQSLVGSGNNAVVVRLCQDDYEYDLSYSAVPDGVTTISEETRQQLLDIDHVLNVSLYNERSYVYNVYYGDNSFTGSLLGIDSFYFETCGYALRAGRYFTDADRAAFKKVCILDSDACSTLFGGKNPVDCTIEILGESYTVAGVVDMTNTYEAEIETVSDYYTYAYSSGGIIFVPIETWPVLYRFDEPQKAVLQADSTDNMTSIGQKAASILTASQISGASANLSYKGENLMEQAEQLQQLSSSSNSLLLWIAGISLLVGGIGVMNIMLVTVTERTQEIGLKKALGARRRRILQQFLTEAGVLTGIGGILGVAAGIGLAKLISSVLGTPTAISVPAIAVAVIFSMLIGIIFGLIPAVKAAKLDPIAALRRE